MQIQNSHFIPKDTKLLTSSHLPLRSNNLSSKITLALVPNFTISIGVSIIRNRFLMVQGTLLYQNGQPVKLGPRYREIFFNVANGGLGGISGSQSYGSQETNQGNGNSVVALDQRASKLKFQYDWEAMEVKFVGKMVSLGGEFEYRRAQDNEHSGFCYDKMVASVIETLKQCSGSLQMALEICGAKSSRNRTTVWIQENKSEKKRRIHEIASGKSVNGAIRFCQKNHLNNLSENSLSGGLQNPQQIGMDQEFQLPIMDLVSYTIHDLQEPSEISSQISGKSSETQKKATIHSGGYFQISKRKVTLIERATGNSLIKELAIKKLKPPVQSQRFRNNEQKVENQYRILRVVKNRRHILQYYRACEMQAKDTILMDYEDYTLKDYLKYNRYMDIRQVLDFSKQLLEAVIDLQISGIVHRDLKPSNILIEKTIGSGKPVLKIIDFSESTLRSDVYNPTSPAKLGCTPPYSPLQCAENAPSGFNSFEIDNWSIGIILFELIFGKTPIYYCRCFGPDIMKAWHKDFYIPLPLGKRSGVEFVESVFKFVTVGLVRTNPKERMDLGKVLWILEVVQEFVEEMSM